MILRLVAVVQLDPLRLFPSELKVPKSDVGKHDYHALKVAVVKDSVFQEEVGAHL